MPCCIFAIAFQINWNEIFCSDLLLCFPAQMKRILAELMQSTCDNIEAFISDMDSNYIAKLKNPFPDEERLKEAFSNFQKVSLSLFLFAPSLCFCLPLSFCFHIFLFSFLPGPDISFSLHLSPLSLGKTPCSVCSQKN